MAALQPAPVPHISKSRSVDSDLRMIVGGRKAIDEFVVISWMTICGKLNELCNKMRSLIYIYNDKKKILKIYIIKFRKFPNSIANRYDRREKSI